MAEELTPKQRSGLQRAIDNPILRATLFKKAIGTKWFNAFDRAGFIDPSEIPKPVPAEEEGYVNIPVWPITDYLVSTSDLFKYPEDRAIAERFMEFIRGATAHAMQEGFGNYRVWWQFSRIVRNIPPDLITLDDVQLFDYWLDDLYERGFVSEVLGESWLKELLAHGDAHSLNLAEALLRALYRIEIVPGSDHDADQKEAKLRIDGWHARKLTENIAARVGETLGLRAVRVFAGFLEQALIELEKDEWSHYWRSAIENHDQNLSGEDAVNVLIEALRDALLAFVTSRPTQGVAYVLELMNSPLKTLRRIAIFSVDQRYSDLAAVTEELISEEYMTSIYRHEMWHFLHNHYGVFSPQMTATVLRKIESLLERDENGQVIDGATAYERSIWLAAIKDEGDNETGLYRKYTAEAGVEPEHPSFSGYISAGWWSHESPISDNELLSMDVDKLVVCLRDYKEPEKYLEPGIKGLCEALGRVVKSEPNKYSTQLQKFVMLDLAFVHEIIEAYRELLVEKATLSWDLMWGHLLDFLSHLVNQEEFWSPEAVRERREFVGNRNWVVGSIARLFEDGAKAGEFAYALEEAKTVKKILLTILDRQEGSKFSDGCDPVSVAINSPRGRCIEAFISLCNFVCLLVPEENGHTRAWQEFEPYFDAELSRSERKEYEFCAIVTSRLKGFMWFSREWVMSRLGRMFDQRDYMKWYCAMNGYAYVSFVDKGTYLQLRNDGHFIKALDDKNLNKRVAEKIVENAVVAYLNDSENVGDENGLLQQLLVRRVAEELKQLIWFVWTLRKSPNERLSQKVFELWPELLRVIDISSRNGKKLASALCRWSVFIEVFNATNRELILSIAKFADRAHNAHDLLEMIARTSKEQPKEAFEVWQAMLEGSSSDYPEESVRTALLNLHTLGQEGVRMAKRIVDAYLEKGNEHPMQWYVEIQQRGEKRGWN